MPSLVCGFLRSHMPFPFPEDAGLGAGPPHAPVHSFSLPLSCFRRGFGKAVEPVWAVSTCPAPASHPGAGY